jgi:peptide deformylase
MILKLVDSGHPMLRQELEEFDFKNPPIDPVQLGNDLIESMKHYQGLGLSANQCGLPYRAFALWSADPLVCFNPRVVDQTSEFVQLEEGCLTYPNLYLKIKRPKAIKVRFQNVYGDTQTEKFIGMTARGFLHEMDHLDGVIYTRRASPMHLSRAQNQKKQLDRQIKRGEVYYKPSNLPNVKLDELTNENPNL